MCGVIKLVVRNSAKSTYSCISTGCTLEVVLKSSALSGLSVGCIATRTLSGLSAVYAALRVVVINVSVSLELVAESLTGGESTYGTSSSLITGSVAVVVSGSIKLGVGVEVATSTGLVICPTLFGTGRSLTCVIYVIVAKSLALGSATCGTGLRSSTVSVCPNVLMGIEYHLGILGITNCEVIDYKTGALAGGPTVDVNALDLELVKSVAVMAYGKVVSECVAELAVDIVANGQGLVSAKVNEHHNVDPTGPALAVYVNSSKISTVVVCKSNLAILCRIDREDIEGVICPTLAGIPRSIVVSCLHYCKACCLGYVRLKLEGDSTGSVATTVEVGEDVSVVSVRSGEIDHVLRSGISTGKYLVHSIRGVNRNIAVLREVVLLIGAVVVMSNVCDEVCRTRCTSVHENLIRVGNGDSVLIEGLAHGLTTAVLTSRGCLAGSGSHVVTKCINSIVLTANLYFTPYTVGSDVVGACFLTLRINLVLGLGIAGLMNGYITLGMSANGTGSGCLAGSAGHLVAKCRNRNGIASELTVTGGTLDNLFVRTLVLTIGSYVILLGRSTCGVTKNRNKSSLGGYATNGTFLVLLTLFITGSRNVLDPVSLGVTKRGKRLSIKNDTTNGTFLMLASEVVTVGSEIYDPVALGMTGSGNNVLRKSGLATNGTYGTVGQAVFSTGSSIAGNGLVSVTERGSVNYLTQSTESGGQAGCFFPNVFEGLTLSNITSCAVLRAVAGCGDPDVAECLTADFAAKATGSGSLTICLFPLVVKCRSLRQVTEGTYLGRATGCFRPCMRKLFTFGSSAGTSLRCLTGSLHPVVHVLRLRLFAKERRKLVARSKCQQKDQ